MTSSVTILLLDDEPMLRRATALLLSNRGGDVTLAATPDEAVALAASRRFDVAVIDLAESARRVLEVAARLRSASAAPGRIVVVCEGPVDVRAAAEADELLRRPYPFDRLLRAIFGVGSRSRTRSGVFPRATRGKTSGRRTGRAGGRSLGPLAAPAGPSGSATSRSPRRAPRAARGPG